MDTLVYIKLLIASIITSIVCIFGAFGCINIVLATIRKKWNLLN